jgi:predicted adenine nucleotide alpha hydrolase (AANH) superfamily ATPase
MTDCLLHICCAPCSITCIETLRREGIEPTGFWYNPNIHPFTEYRSRKTTLQAYAESIGMTLLVSDDYGLRAFVRAIYPDLEDRCETCYRLRMDETARRAAEEGFEAFTTTLLISPYQNHELLIATAEAAAKKHGVTFLYRDFRPTFREGQQKARELELYMQKYCGCVFSEEERYRKKK